MAEVRWQTQADGDGEEFHRGIEVPWVLWSKLHEGRCEMCGDVVRLPTGNRAETIVEFMRAYVNAHAICGVRAQPS